MNIIQLQPTDNVEQFNDDQLIMAHMTTHAYYREFRQGRGDQFEGWEMSDLVEKHQSIRQEMESREIQHDRINALDEEATGVEQSADKTDRNDVSWMFQAQDFIETNDKSINLSEYVQLSHTAYDDLEEWVQGWADVAIDNKESFGLIAKQADNNVGAFLASEGDNFNVYLNDVSVYQSDTQEVAASIFMELAEEVEQAESPKEAYNSTFVKQQDWTVPDDPEEYEMADPEMEWGEVDTTLTAYQEAFGYDPDDDNWNDMAEEDRVEITRYFSASREGVPADTFGDLWGPHHNPEGEVVRNGVIAAKAANSGARAEPNTPQSLRGEIEDHLNEHLEEFAEEYDDIEPPGEETEQANQFRVIKNASEDYKWYIWNKTEVDQWLSDQGYDDVDLERDGSYLRANLTTEVEQAHPKSERAIMNQVRTTDQHGDGDGVVIRGAENEDQDFFLAAHIIGDEVERQDAANLSEPLGVAGPYPADQMLLPMSFMVDDPIPDGRRFFVVQWTDDDGQPGEPITGEDGDFVMDDAIYYHTPTGESGPAEEVVQNTGTYRSWQGRRTPPEEISQEDKPRRVVMNRTEDGSEMQAIEFPVRGDFAQTAAMVMNKFGFDKETLEGMLNE